MPTSRCNLACDYCYSSPGAIADLDDRSIEDFFSYISNQIIGKEICSVWLHFHGGGEPTLRLDCLQRCVSSATRWMPNALVKTTITSNGLFSLDIQNWLSQKADVVTVSVDGDEEVHALQRSQSEIQYEQIIENVKSLVSNGVAVRIRSTITRNNVGNYSKYLRELNETTGVSKFFVEPVAMTGRAKKRKDLVPTEKELWRCYLELESVVSSTEVTVNFCQIAVGKRRGRYCGAYGSNTVLTPEGKLSLCYEATDASMSFSESFLTRARIDEDECLEEFKRIKERTNKENSVRVRNDCKGCIAFSMCGGGCVVRRKTSRDTSKDNVCTLRRRIVVRKIEEMAREMKLSGRRRAVIVPRDSFSASWQ